MHNQIKRVRDGVDPINVVRDTHSSDGRVEDDPVPRGGVQRDPISYGIKIPIVITYLKKCNGFWSETLYRTKPSPATR
jgi:hypothetical protein